MVLTRQTFTNKVVSIVAADIVPFDSAIMSYFNAVFISIVVRFTSIPVIVRHLITVHIDPVSFSFCV